MRPLDLIRAKKGARKPFEAKKGAHMGPLEGSQVIWLEAVAPASECLII